MRLKEMTRLLAFLITETVWAPPALASQVGGQTPFPSFSPVQECEVRVLVGSPIGAHRLAAESGPRSHRVLNQS